MCIIMIIEAENAAQLIYRCLNPQIPPKNFFSDVRARGESSYNQ